MYNNYDYLLRQVYTIALSCHQNKMIENTIAFSHRYVQYYRSLVKICIKECRLYEFNVTLKYCHVYQENIKCTDKAKMDQVQNGSTNKTLRVQQVKHRHNSTCVPFILSFLHYVGELFNDI